AASAAAAPGDGDLAVVAAHAADAFVAAVQLEVQEHVGRRDFTRAQTAIVDAIAGSAVPHARRPRARGRPWARLPGESGRLVRRALHEDDDGAASSSDATAAETATGPGAITALAAAAAVVAAVPVESLTPDRRQELARRLWWAHMQLGGARRAQGDLEGALAPLAAAVELAGGDAGREGGAREAGGRGIEALVGRLRAGSRRRAREGELDAAIACARH